MELKNKHRQIKDQRLFLQMIWKKQVHSNTISLSYLQYYIPVIIEIGFLPKFSLKKKHYGQLAAQLATRIL